MPGSSQFGAAPEPASGKERRLESWGEIASYLRREIRTVQRWEKTLGLPIHRLRVGKQSSVYAYPSELNKWYLEREPKELKDDEPAEDPAPDEPFYKRKAVWLAGMAGLLVLGGFAIVALNWTPQPRNLIASAGKLRLFVRPFQAVAGDASLVEFTEGLTSELNTRLGRLDPTHLGVIAPTSSKQLGAKPISELEPLLKLNYVLEGRVQRANDKIRIDISLISAREQTQLWSDSYTDSVSDILKVQEEVAETVAQKLAINLPPSISAGSASSVDPAGYDAYLRGRRYWAARDLARSVPA